MSQRLYRAAPVDLEVDSSGRTIVGIAVPFGMPATVRDGFGESYTEQFRRGAFARTISERGTRVKVLANHERRSLPLGRASLLREDAAGLYAELRVSETAAGDEVLALVRDGALDGLSIGFRPIRQLSTGDRVVERVEVRLDEISVVGFPAYDGAVIAGVRSATPSLTVEAARRRLAILQRS